MNTWHPVRYAPDNGTFLGMREGWLYPRLVHHGLEFGPQGYMMGRLAWSLVVDHADGFFGHRQFAPDEAPTHWMPIPPFPKKEAK